MKRRIFVMSSLIKRRNISAVRVNKAKKDIQIKTVLTNFNLGSAFS